MIQPAVDILRLALDQRLAPVRPEAENGSRMCGVRAPEPQAQPDPFPADDSALGEAIHGFS